MPHLFRNHMSNEPIEPDKSRRQVSRARRRVAVVALAFIGLISTLNLLILLFALAWWLVTKDPGEFQPAMVIAPGLVCVAVAAAAYWGAKKLHRVREP